MSDGTTSGPPGLRESRRRVAFLGPPGTFGEEALLSLPDVADDELVAMPSMPDVLAAVEAGEVDLGFVAIENSIEGTVNEVLDALIFDHHVLVQREVVYEVTQNLLVPPGTSLADVQRVVSYPNALGQCRQWVATNLPGAVHVAANSTSEAARQVAAEGGPSAAIGTALAGKLYNLDIAASHIEDHAGNVTRFVMVAAPGPGRIPAPTGHDKTSIVCFQRADVPGSLLSILAQFAARGINLTKLESRPTKRGLGDYCFIIDMEGHIADELAADCLRDLHASLASLKFLGSYPASGDHGRSIRRDAQASWRNAEEWLLGLRRQVAPD